MNSHEIQNRIEQHLLEHFFPNKQRTSISHDESLLSLGILDSFAFLELIGFLEQEFGITIDDAEVTPENFESLNSLAALITRAQHGNPM